MARRRAAADDGAVVVVSAFALTLLAIAAGLQVTARKDEVDPLALAYALGSFAVALVGALQLFDDTNHRGIALLVAAGVWAVTFVALHVRRLPDLAFAVGVSALALAAVGTAFLLVAGRSPSSGPPRRSCSRASPGSSVTPGCV